MKLNLQKLNIRNIRALDAWVEQQIRKLTTQRRIDQANVRVVRLLDSSPPYQVNVHLVTPGPDLFAEARDHTVRAAFTKVMLRLTAQIAQRSDKKLRRIKSNLSAPALTFSGSNKAG